MKVGVCEGVYCEGGLVCEGVYCEGGCSVMVYIVKVGG